MSTTLSIDIADPRTWPMRMTHEEVAAVLRISRRTLYERMAKGLAPEPSADRTWARAVIQRYVEGGIDRHAKVAERHMRVVGGQR
jgi:predicted DNA-binding transcriptional regulator AlpA